MFLEIWNVKAIKAITTHVAKHIVYSEKTHNFFMLCRNTIVVCHDTRLLTNQSRELNMLQMRKGKN